MGAYNLWGKRCPIPPVTDVIQGLAWGSLTVYAARAFGATPNAMTWILAAYATGFTLFMNGIHGGLRDLNNDLASGARTTAIFLGARPATDGGDPIVPRAVAIFASSALAGLIGIGLMLMLRNDFWYGPVVWTATTVAVGALYLLALMLLPKVVHPRGAVWDVAFRLQAYLVLMGLPVAFVAYASVKTLLVLLLLAVISVLLLEWPSVIARWYAQRCEESLRRGSSAPTTENADAEERKSIALRQPGVIVLNKPAN